MVYLFTFYVVKQLGRLCQIFVLHVSANSSIDSEDVLHLRDESNDDLSLENDSLQSDIMIGNDEDSTCTPDNPLDEELNSATPTNKKIVEKDIPGHIPLPFRQNLLWPNKTDIDNTKKRKKKEILPAVTVSDQWKDYYKKKEEQKIQKDLEKEQRKVLLEEKKMETIKKAEETANKKAERSLRMAEVNKIKAERKAERELKAAAKKIAADKKAEDRKRKLNFTNESKRNKVENTEEEYEM